MVMKYPSRSFGNLRVLAKNKATTATTPSPRSESTSSFQFTPRIQYVSPMLVPGREALAALVTAICHLDLPLILKTLKSKWDQQRDLFGRCDVFLGNLQRHLHLFRSLQHCKPRKRCFIDKMASKSSLRNCQVSRQLL